VVGPIQVLLLQVVGPIQGVVTASGGSDRVLLLQVVGPIQVLLLQIVGPI